MSLLMIDPEVAILEAGDLPGPAEYDPLHELGRDALKYSLRGRLNSKDPDACFYPGPGEYKAYPDIGEDAVKYSLLPRLADPVDPHAEEPGPGHYKVSREPGRDAPKYSLYSRRDPAVNRNPGPGTYDPDLSPVSHAQPKYSMGKRTGPVEKVINSTPGPGAHNVRPTIGKGSQGIGSQNITLKGRFLPPKQHYPSPGPAQYTIDKSKQAFKAAPAYSMPKHQVKPPVQDDQPGPGTYDLGTTLGKSTAKTIKGRIDYSPNQGYTPGPGAYRMQRIFAKHCPKMAIHLPLKHRPYNDSPGPAAYDMKRDLGGDGPKYSLGGRTAIPRPKAVSPGPVYLPEVKSRGPSFSMRSSKSMPNLDPTADNPGPGHYEPKLRRAPSFTIARRPEERPRLFEDPPTPGPASYSPPSCFTTGPSFSMGGRHSRSKSRLRRTLSMKSIPHRITPLADRNLAKNATC